MDHDAPAYGLWTLVLINSLVFILFAFSFTKPRTTRDWRSLGMLSAFIVALFTEMYGFPLTLYLLSGWLARRFPGIDFMAHDAGHFLEFLFGWWTNPHWGPFHQLGNLLIFAGFWLLAVSWRVLYHAQQHHQLALSGPYARLRHPQYAGFVVIMFGFLLQWPTLITLVMFPVMVWAYGRLARREEADLEREFGAAYRRYAEQTPAFIPTWSNRQRTL
jgi:protein-S-isoprenylcysteine O-methyltransferase Ste14